MCNIVCIYVPGNAFDESHKPILLSCVCNIPGDFVDVPLRQLGLLIKIMIY